MYVLYMYGIDNKETFDKFVSIKWCARGYMKNGDETIIQQIPVWGRKYLVPLCESYFWLCLLCAFERFI